MTRCDHCGNDVVPPFSCQYCGGKHCAECRLPPNHDCINIALWNSKPRPAIGISYKKGGGATPTGGGNISESRHDAKKKTGQSIPYMKIMIAIVILIIIGIAWLIFSGYHMG